MSITQEPDAAVTADYHASEVRHATARKQPPRLYVLLVTEACERFSSYLLLALLTVYLIEHFGWPAESALRANGVVLALSYGLSLPIGMWADRFKAHAAAVGIGCGLMACGYLFVAYGRVWTTIAGLGLLSVGGGLFKPCILALLSRLYSSSDSRREAGFVRFYVSANIGALLAPPVSEWLRRKLGWPSVLGTAAIIQAAGTAYFCWSWRRLPVGSAHGDLALRQQPRQQPLQREDRQRALTLIILTAVSLWFWIALQQTGGTLTLFARDHTDRYVRLPLPSGWTNWELPVGWMTSIHSGLVIVLSPLVTALWHWRRQVRRPISGSAQMAVGMALLGLAYGSLLPPLYVSPSARAGLGWLLTCYVALSLAEIYIGALGHSLVSRHAPPGYAGLFSGMWLIVTAAGSYLAGELGARWWTHATPLKFFAALSVASMAACVGVWGMQRLGANSPLIARETNQAEAPRGQRSRRAHKEGQCVTRSSPRCASSSA